MWLSSTGISKIRLRTFAPSYLRVDAFARRTAAAHAPSVCRQPRSSSDNTKLRRYEDAKALLVNASAAQRAARRSDRRRSLWLSSTGISKICLRPFAPSYLRVDAVARRNAAAHAPSVCRRAAQQ
jgi:hypothetical protein